MVAGLCSMPDMARNFTYDSILQDGYDACNRVIKTDRVSTGRLRSGSVIDTLRDDGVNRRIEKVTNTPNEEENHSIS